MARLFATSQLFHLRGGWKSHSLALVSQTKCFAPTRKHRKLKSRRNPPPNMRERRECFISCKTLLSPPPWAKIGKSCATSNRRRKDVIICRARIKFLSFSLRGWAFYFHYLPEEQTIWCIERLRGYIWFDGRYCFQGIVYGESNVSSSQLQEISLFLNIDEDGLLSPCLSRTNKASRFTCLTDEKSEPTYLCLHSAAILNRKLNLRKEVPPIIIFFPLVF